jgi:hypothetical protein
MRRTQDAGGGVNVMDVPFRFVPCMVAGLAYYIALKVPGGMDRLTVVPVTQPGFRSWVRGSRHSACRTAIERQTRILPFLGPNRQHWLGCSGPDRGSDVPAGPYHRLPPL